MKKTTLIKITSAIIFLLLIITLIGTIVFTIISRAKIIVKDNLLHSNVELSTENTDKVADIIIQEFKASDINASTCVEMNKVGDVYIIHCYNRSCWNYDLNKNVHITLDKEFNIIEVDKGN